MAPDKVSVLAPEENRAGPILTALARLWALCSLLLFSLGLSLLACVRGSLKNPPHGRSKCRGGRSGMLCEGLLYGNGLTSIFLWRSQRYPHFKQAAWKQGNGTQALGRGRYGEAQGRLGLLEEAPMLAPGGGSLRWDVTPGTLLAPSVVSYL